MRRVLPGTGSQTATLATSEINQLIYGIFYKALRLELLLLQRLERVLVVDDYPDTAESMATCLDAAGLETKVTRDAVEALEIANEWHPTVCIIDLTMPRCDGFELAQRVRSQEWSARTVLIAHTGWTGDEMRKRAHAAGFDGYLTKPADPGDLLRMIEEKVKQQSER